MYGMKSCILMLNSLINLVVSAQFSFWSRELGGVQQHRWAGHE